MFFTFGEFKHSVYAKSPHYMVIGNPVKHSFSPSMHNWALNHFGMDAHYYAIELQQSELPDFISWMNRDEFLGCNITIPYKELLFSAVDEHTSIAASLQTINTISKSNGGSVLSGHNTDVFGFIKPLEPYFDRIDGSRAIIFGTGGASKAVQFALADAGIEELIYVSRSPSSVSLPQTDVYTRVVEYNQWPDFADDADLFINTTPVGMGNLKDKSIIDKSHYSLLDNKLCYDLIYNPQETVFLTESKSHGAVCINGLDMLIYQGQKSFEIWTDQTFPIEPVKETLQPLIYP